MEEPNKNNKLEGNQSLDAVVSVLATSGVDLQSLEGVINTVRQTMRDPESSDRGEANKAFDTIVQTLHDQGINLNDIEQNINNVRIAIKG